MEQICCAVDQPCEVKLESTASLSSIATARPVDAACPSSWAVKVGSSPTLNRFCMSRPRFGRWPATRCCMRSHSVAVSLCTVWQGCLLLHNTAASMLHSVCKHLWLCVQKETFCKCLSYVRIPIFEGLVIVECRCSSRGCVCT